MATCVTEPIKYSALLLLDFKLDLSFTFMNICINLTVLIKLQMSVPSPKWKKVQPYQKGLNIEL